VTEGVGGGMPNREEANVPVVGVIIDRPTWLAFFRFLNCDLKGVTGAEAICDDFIAFGSTAVLGLVLAVLTARFLRFLDRLEGVAGGRLPKAFSSECDMDGGPIGAVEGRFGSGVSSEGDSPSKESTVEGMSRTGSASSFKGESVVDADVDGEESQGSDAEAVSLLLG